MPPFFVLTFSIPSLSRASSRHAQSFFGAVRTNGKFLWKISGYLQLFQQSATKKEKERLCSPPFYTGHYGYKLWAEAFLNGLGKGKGTHHER